MYRSRQRNQWPDGIIPVSHKSVQWEPTAKCPIRPTSGGCLTRATCVLAKRGRAQLFDLRVLWRGTGSRGFMSRLTWCHKTARRESTLRDSATSTVVSFHRNCASAYGSGTDHVTTSGTEHRSGERSVARRDNARRSPGTGFPLTRGKASPSAFQGTLGKVRVGPLRFASCPFKLQVRLRQAAGPFSSHPNVRPCQREV